MSAMMDRTSLFEQMSFDLVTELRPPSIESTPKKTKKKGGNWKKPDDMPKRPLSAYNLFFADERKKLMEEGYLNKGRTTSKNKIGQQEDSKGKNNDKPKKGKMNFAGLARNIAAKWKLLDPVDKKQYEKVAQAEREIYNKKMKEYRIAQKALKQKRDAEEIKSDSLLSALQMQQDQYDMPSLHGSNARIPRGVQQNMPNKANGLCKADLATLLQDSLKETLDELGEDEEFGISGSLTNPLMSMDISRDKQNLPSGFAFLSLQKLAFELDEDESNFLVETFRAKK